MDLVDIVVDFIPREMFTTKCVWHIYSLEQMSRVAFLSPTVKRLEILISLPTKKQVALLNHIPSTVVYVSFHKIVNSFTRLPSTVTIVSLSKGGSSIVTLPTSVQFLHVQSFTTINLKFPNGIRILLYTGRNPKSIPKIPEFVRYLVFTTRKPLILTRLIALVPNTVEKVIVHSGIQRYQYLHIHRSKIIKVSNLPHGFDESLTEYISS